MTLLTRKIALTLMVALTAISAQGQAPPSVDSIVAQFVAARGGLARLHAVQTERLSGQFRLGPGVEGSIVYEIKRPGSIRMGLTILDSLIVRTYDAQTGQGWEINPFSHSRAPRSLSADEAHNLSVQADLDGALTDYVSKGNKVSLLRLDTASARPVYVLQVVTPSSDTEAFSIDQQTHLVLRWASRRVIKGVPTAFQVNYTDYRPVDSLMFPFHMTIDINGSTQEQELTVETIQLNTDEPDSRFAKPDTSSGSVKGP